MNNIRNTVKIMVINYNPNIHIQYQKLMKFSSKMEQMKMNIFLKFKIPGNIVNNLDFKNGLVLKL